LNPGAQNNDGSFRPITVTAPKGCLLNASHPLPVWGRHLSGHYVPAIIYGALSKVVPEKVISESGSPLWNVYFKGLDSCTGKPFVKMFFMNGGHGARPDRDGPGCLSFPSNVSNQPIEEFESQVPLLVTEKTLASDTAGPGRYRGGPGQRISFRCTGDTPVHVVYRHERVKYPPRGLLGGKAGSPGLEMINGKKTPSKFQTTLVTGDTLTIQTPGGGGMYPPLQRDANRIVCDLRSEIYGTDFVNRHYGRLNPMSDPKNA
jgi:N-methylhydantoinase B